jgi:DNA-binding transcriptional LysR family regulator
MKLELIETFLATLTHGSIRAAARQMGLSQPGVSRKLRQLEEELGVALLKRSAQGVTLTVYGEAFARRARTIVNETQRAVGEVAQMRGEREGVVRIMLAPASSVDWVARAVGLFQRDCPGVRLDIYEGMQEQAVERLRSGSLDFAVSPLWQALPDSEFQAEPLQRMDMAVVTRKDGRFRHCRHLDELISAPWLHVGAGTHVSPLVVDLFRHFGLSAPPPKMESYSLTSTLAFLLDSDAVTLLPAKFGRQPLYADVLTELPISDPLPTQDLYLVQRRESPLTPTSAILAGHIRRVAMQLAN